VCCPHRGWSPSFRRWVSVASYGAQEVRDFFALFATMEGAVAALAATRRTDADLRALNEISARIGALLDEDDLTSGPTPTGICNREFHAQIMPWPIPGSSRT